MMILLSGLTARIREALCSFEKYQMLASPRHLSSVASANSRKYDSVLSASGSSCSREKKLGSLIGDMYTSGCSPRYPQSDVVPAFGAPGMKRFGHGGVTGPESRIYDR